jgi:hypothetical protein
MLIRRRVLLIDPSAPSPSGSAGAVNLQEVASASSSVSLEIRKLLVVTSPANLANVILPFTALGTATPGATIRVFNDATSLQLGTVTANLISGAWSIQINSM